MVDVVKPDVAPNVAGKSIFSAGIGFNAYTPDRVLFGLLSNFNAIRDNLRNIIFFRKGDYPDNPDFGIGLQDYLFDPADEVMRLALGREISRQIARYEPRVTIRSLDVSTPTWADNAVVVDMDLLVNNVPLSGVAAATGTFVLSESNAA